LDTLKLFHFIENEESEKRARDWNEFLLNHHFDFSGILKIDMTKGEAQIFDHQKNKFSIDFIGNKLNYAKKKGSLKTELIARALGSGRMGMTVLDLSAGLGIDALFLAQLGFNVTSIERNPLIYLALRDASENLPSDTKIEFIFNDALAYLKNSSDPVDVIYFDPMFPEKPKSALPRQEMVFFKGLVGSDNDAIEVLQLAQSHLSAERVAVKRPLKAPILGGKPIAQIKGKLIRFDIYGVKNERH
jgi:16S rRNA (guanine1516-N2)-methyltransferase